MGREAHPGCGGVGGRTSLPLGGAPDRLQAVVGGWATRLRATPGRRVGSRPRRCKAEWGGSAAAFTTWTSGARSTRLQGGVGGSPAFYHWAEHHRCKAGVGGRTSFTTGQEQAQRGVGGGRTTLSPAASGWWVGRHQLTTGRSTTPAARRVWGVFGYYHGQEHTRQRGWVGPAFTHWAGAPPRLAKQGGVCGLGRALYHCARAPAASTHHPAEAAWWIGPALSFLWNQLVGWPAEHWAQESPSPAARRGGVGQFHGAEHTPGCKAGSWGSGHTALHGRGRAPTPAAWEREHHPAATVWWSEGLTLAEHPGLQGSLRTACRCLYLYLLALPCTTPVPKEQTGCKACGVGRHYFFTTAAGQEHHPGLWVGSRHGCGWGWQLYHWQHPPAARRVGGSDTSLTTTGTGAPPGCKRRVGGSAPALPLGSSTTPAEGGGWVVGTSHFYHWAESTTPAARRGGGSQLSCGGSTFTTGQEHHLVLRAARRVWVGRHSFTTGQEHHHRLQAVVGSAPALPLGRAPPGACGGSAQLYQLAGAPPGCKAGWGGSQQLYHGRSTPAARRGGLQSPGAPPPAAGGCGGSAPAYHWRSSTTRLQGGCGWVGTSFTTGQRTHPGCKRGGGSAPALPLAGAHPAARRGGWVGTSFTTGQEPTTRLQGGVGGSAPALPLGRSTTPAARRGGWVGTAFHWAGAPGCTSAGGWVAPALPLGRSTTRLQGGWVGRHQLAAPPGCQRVWWAAAAWDPLTLGRSTTPAARRGGWVAPALPLGEHTRLQGGQRVGGSAPALHWAEHHPAARRGGGSDQLTTGRSTPGCRRVGAHSALPLGRAPRCKAVWVGRHSFTWQSTTPAEGGVGGSAQLTLGRSTKPGCRRVWWVAPGFTKVLLLHLQAHRLQGGWVGRHSFTTGRSTTRLQGGLPWVGGVGTSFYTGAREHDTRLQGGWRWSAPLFTGQEHHPAARRVWVGVGTAALPAWVGPHWAGASTPLALGHQLYWAGAPPGARRVVGGSAQLPLGRRPPRLQGGVGGSGHQAYRALVRSNHPAASAWWVVSAPALVPRTGQSTTPGCKAVWVSAPAYTVLAGAPPRLQGGVMGGRHSFFTAAPPRLVVAPFYHWGRRHHRLQGGCGWSKLEHSLPFFTGQEHHPGCKRWVGRHQLLHWAGAPPLQGGCGWVGIRFPQTSTGGDHPGAGGWVGRHHYWAGAPPLPKRVWVGPVTALLQGRCSVSFTTGQSNPGCKAVGVGGSHQLYHWQDTTPAAQGGVGGSVSTSLHLGRRPAPPCKRVWCGRHQLYFTEWPAFTTPAAAGGWVASAQSGAHPGCKAGGWVDSFTTGTGSTHQDQLTLQGAGPAPQPLAPRKERAARVWTSCWQRAARHQLPAGGWFFTGSAGQEHHPACKRVGGFGKGRRHHRLQGGGMCLHGWVFFTGRACRGVGGLFFYPLQGHHTGCRAGLGGLGSNLGDPQPPITHAMERICGGSAPVNHNFATPRSTLQGLCGTV
ncbi:hypothetical protein C0Q70_09134 [Pomacea canaliculata]|uniref:Uncharacterized protein n=1 Tax=Pomacea canaliculata TaxID=400727 RepID=A0A2T7P8W9_POMCA|nr:hypothetical protein C0Q70_09134 [Pomacea canaliculata]